MSKQLPTIYKYYTVPTKLFLEQSLHRFQLVAFLLLSDTVPKNLNTSHKCFAAKFMAAS